MTLVTLDVHKVTPPYHVGVFVAWRAAALIAVIATLGYGIGSIGAGIWNWLHRDST